MEVLHDMEIGVGTITYEFAGLPLKSSIKRISNFGIKYVDVLAFGDYNPAFLPIFEQEEIGRELKDLGMHASSVITCAHGNLASDDSNEVKFALEQLKLAGKLIKNLGGKQVLIGKGVGNMDFHLSREKAWENSVKILKEYCRWAADEGIIVTMELEPEVLHVCNNICSMAKIFEETDAKNLFANADIGHLNILRTRPDELRILKDKIIHVHISDNDGLAHTNSVIGEGNTDIRWFIDQILDFGIDKIAQANGDVAVAGIEVGAPGEYIKDADFRILKSMGNVLSRVPRLRK